MFIEIYNCHKEVLKKGKPMVTFVDENIIKCQSYTPKKGWENIENIPMRFTEETTPLSNLKYGCTRCLNIRCNYVMPCSLGSVAEI
jgi:hypothetical protein